MFLSVEADTYVSFLYTLPEEFLNKKAIYSNMDSKKHAPLKEMDGAATCKLHSGKDHICFLLIPVFLMSKMLLGT